MLAVQIKDPFFSTVRMVAAQRTPFFCQVAAPWRGLGGPAAGRRGHRPLQGVPQGSPGRREGARAVQAPARHSPGEGSAESLMFSGLGTFWRGFFSFNPLMPKRYFCTSI